MKIVHVLFSRGFAGSERSTAESCNQQCRNNDVWLIIRKDHRRNGLSVTDHIDEKVRVIELAPGLLMQWQLSRIIKQMDPDIIHCHLRRATRLISRIRCRAKTVSTLHIGVNGRHFLKMDGLICNARWQVNSVPVTYSGKIFKANNSLVPHRRLEQAERQQLRSELGIRKDELLIGAVGRLHSSKGWDLLIKAFNNIENTGNVRLLLFGQGGQESQLRELAADNPSVMFCGHRSNIKDLYQCFDLCVCPSRFEPLPRVMLEAMDAGIPVVASDTGGCGELIEDYGGDMFPSGNTGALEIILRNYIARPDTLNHFRPDLSQHYIDATDAALQQFYRTLLRSGPVSSPRLINPGLL